MTPNIRGVGVVRQRYPIMPVHQAGSFVFKELDALKDVTLQSAKYKRFYRQKTNSNGTIEEVFVINQENKHAPLTLASSIVPRYLARDSLSGDRESHWHRKHKGSQPGIPRTDNFTSFFL